MKKATQCEHILRDLKRGWGITQAKAYEKYGILRLSGRISDLREMGYSIKTNMIAVKNRYGETCYVAEYRLEK